VQICSVHVMQLVQTEFWRACDVDAEIGTRSFCRLLGYFLRGDRVPWRNDSGVAAPAESGSQPNTPIKLQTNLATATLLNDQEERGSLALLMGD
jgi:hypothetical protein